MKFFKYFSAIVLTILLGAACKNDGWENPYDDPSIQPPPDTSDVVHLDRTTIEGLHHYIFKPTCANSGCHDGAFAPDFRSIESSYNTLIYQPVVKNDPGGTYTYRVVPGDAINSVLYQRLIVDIDGNSGIMPLSAEYDPNDPWWDVKEEYIPYIRTWIENGALDMFGNAPQSGNVRPQLTGVMAYGDGVPLALERGPGNGPIIISDSLTTVDLYFSVYDPETASGDLTDNKIKIGGSINDFQNVPAQNLTFVTPVTGEGYLGAPVQYDRKFTITPANYSLNSTFFIRIFVQDSDTLSTELPNQNSANYIKEYAAFKIE